MLTDAVLEALTPTGKPYRRADGNGLCIEVSASGERIWRFRYRHNGKTRMIGMGTWPEVSLSEARGRCDEAHRELAFGIDTGIPRPAELPAVDLTFSLLAGEWRNHRHVSEAVATKDAWLLAFALDAFGDRPAAGITGVDVLALLQSLAECDPPETARRLRAKISAVFRYGKRYLATRNDPTADLPSSALRTPKIRRHFAITELHRVGELLRAIDAYSGHFVSCCALRLAPLVFVRHAELRAAEWSEIDLDGAMWCIPASKMKPRIVHRVPLSSQAVAILRDVCAATGRGRFVFPSEHSAHRPMSESTLILALRSMGYSGDILTGPGFGSLAAALLHKQGHRSEVTGRQLARTAHAAIRDARDDVQYLQERRALMQAWADCLDRLRLAPA